jgi:hypothetical protein
MADGYVLIEINTEGEGRVNPNERPYWYDFRLEDVYFDDIEGVEQLMSQLPDLKDCLVMVHFDYKCNCSRGWEGDYDCEEILNLTHYYIVKEGYKEFYREMVTCELNYGINGYDQLECMPEEDGPNHYKHIVGEWEEFYDEDFVPFKKQPKTINGVVDLWSLIQNKDY